MTRMECKKRYDYVAHFTFCVKTSCIKLHSFCLHAMQAYNFHPFIKPEPPVESVLDPDYWRPLFLFGLPCNVRTKKRTLDETWRNPETPLLTKRRRRKLRYK